MLALIKTFAYLTLVDVYVEHTKTLIKIKIIANKKIYICLYFLKEINTKMWTTKKVTTTNWSVWAVSELFSISFLSLGFYI